MTLRLTSNKGIVILCCDCLKKKAFVSLEIIITLRYEMILVFGWKI